MSHLAAARIPLLLAAALICSACGPQIIDPTKYDQTCTQDTDCVPVGSGDVCTPCGCASTAVNTKDIAKYRADVEALKRGCGPKSTALCAPCQQAEGACVQGACTVRYP